MTVFIKKCSRCKHNLYSYDFNLNRHTRDGRQAYCKDCQQQYGREYILPALRGRGARKVLPSWVKGLVSPPVKLPAKVIHIRQYLNPTSHQREKKVVIG